MTHRKNWSIIDTTLREGEQTPGLLFSLEEKKKICNLLYQIGIAEVELGICSQHHNYSKQLISYCREYLPGLAVSLWSRCRKDDILIGYALQPDILSLSIPVSDLHLRERLQKDRNWAMESMTCSILQARKLGLRVSIGFEDATRSDTDFLLEMAKKAEESGAERIRIADTVGVSNPFEFGKLISTIQAEISNCQLAAHTHNDFGMATANAIGALESGASFVDGVVLGLGERAGCARLEELVGYLQLIKKQDQLRVDKIKPLATFVSQLAGRTIAGSHPIIGKDIFTCDTGLHIQGLLNKPATYEPYSPINVGAKRKLLYGAKSGKQAILGLLRKHKNSQSESITPTTIKAIRNGSRKLGRPLNDTEVLQYFDA